MNNNKLTVILTFMFVLCVGLTDAQYNDGVRRIVFDSITEDTSDFVNTLLKKAIRVKRNGNALQKVGAECFILDLYESQTGSRDRHGAFHWVETNVGEINIISNSERGAIGE